MKMDIFTFKHNNVLAENKLLKFAIVVIGTVVLINTYLLYSYLNSSRTVVVPPKINSKLEIYGNKASDAYYKEFTRYIMALRLNYTPATIRAQFGELLTLFIPSVYGKAEEAFYDLADKVERAKVSSSFFLAKIEVQGNAIHAFGRRHIYSLTGEMVQDTAEEYIIRFRMDNGRFYLTDIPNLVGEKKAGGK